MLTGWQKPVRVPGGVLLANPASRFFARIISHLCYQKKSLVRVSSFFVTILPLFAMQISRAPALPPENTE
jgi:hypothetical protein